MPAMHLLYLAFYEPQLATIDDRGLSFATLLILNRNYLNMQPECAPEEVGLSSERLENITQWMADKVDSGMLPNALTAVLRGDKLVYLKHCGQADMENDIPVSADTIYRFYSMTKPITTVAAMMLYEQGKFQLDDPVSKYIPALGNMEVFVSGDENRFQTEPATRDFTVREIMTHTSGLTYGWMEAHPVDAIYRARKIDFQTAGVPLAELMERLGDVPLICQPGAEWNYSVSTDVLGHLVEIWSGRTLDEYFQEKILGPLGMVDTAFQVAPENVKRFTANYTCTKDRKTKLIEAIDGSRFTKPVVTFSGGGGLTSTVGDYIRFMRLMANYGELDGVRLLGRKTVEYMTINHLPGDLASMGQPSFAETPFDGIGFGLGFSVTLDPAVACILGTAGEYSWGGAASTTFWIDPEEDMSVIFLTQLMPSSAYPLRRELRVLSYQTLIDT
jgi:CubicO group peptidase (beta-lactamase class C family)